MPLAVTVPGPLRETVSVNDCVLAIVNVLAFETLPSGFATMTSALPAAAISEAAIEAVSCVALTNVVVRALPFQRTTEPLTKLPPFTVNVKAGLPAVALLGDSDVKLGGTPFATLTTTFADCRELPAMS